MESDDRSCGTTLLVGQCVASGESDLEARVVNGMASLNVLDKLGNVFGLGRWAGAWDFDRFAVGSIDGTVTISCS